MTLAAALALFLLSAPFGLYLAVRHLRSQPAPLGPALAHGAFGAAGLLTLAAILHRTGFSGRAALALGVLVAAALGGFLLFSFRLRAKAPPAAVIAVHALVALAGVGVLAYAVFVP